MTLLLSIYIIACIIYLGFCVHIVLEETADVSECELKRGIFSSFERKRQKAFIYRLSGVFSV